jgi:uncharacterized protein YndB with AHSA1/START domain
MTRIYTTIQIDRPLAQVFEFVTTPANWPQWHPSSLGVSAGADHSLAVGERVVEEFLVAGRRGRVIWIVKERAEPHRWVIAGEIIGRNNGGVITYQLSAKENGTFFEREFVYNTPGLIFPLLDRLVVRRRVEWESAEALRRLKNVLEG